MIEQFFPNRALLDQLHAGPLGAYIDAFAEEVSERGYAVWTEKFAMRLVAALSSWLVQESLTITDLNESRLEAFFRYRYREFRQHSDDRPVLAYFLAYLREQGAVTPVVERKASDERSRLREAFGRHLANQRNLVPTTVGSYLDTIGHFLDWRFGTQSLNWAHSVSKT